MEQRERVPALCVGEKRRLRASLEATFALATPRGYRRPHLVVR